jgi:hypothetical protein
VNLRDSLRNAVAGKVASCAHQQTQRATSEGQSATARATKTQQASVAPREPSSRRATDDATTTQQGSCAPDREARVVCINCRHARGDRCAAHPRSGLSRGFIGGIKTLRQNCPCFEVAT